MPHEETPYNPPWMDEYIAEGARKNSELLNRLSNAEKWPAGATVRMSSRWRVRAGKENGIRPGTVAILTRASSIENAIGLSINPALGWEGTYQELHDEWESVPDETPPTF